MEWNKQKIKGLLLVVCGGVAFYCALQRLDAVLAALGWLLGILAPFLLGGALAFILNVPMRAIERHLFPRNRKGAKLRRPLALVLTLMLRDARRQLPRRLVMFSPWTDMTFSGESFTQRAGDDPSLTADYMLATRDAYAPGADWTDPLLSPLFGDFSGFPPVMIQAGSNEILFDDSARLHQRLLEQGVPCRMECWEDMWHVFQMFPLKQADRAVDHVAQFLLELF